MKIIVILISILWYVIEINVLFVKIFEFGFFGGWFIVVGFVFFVFNVIVGSELLIKLMNSSCNVVNGLD